MFKVRRRILFDNQGCWEGLVVFFSIVRHDVLFLRNHKKMHSISEKWTRTEEPSCFLVRSFLKMQVYFIVSFGNLYQLCCHSVFFQALPVVNL
jgi:hypothetical protein